MNQAGIFGSDINFTPAAGVYPTAGGGTSAAAASAMSATTNTVVDPGNGGAPAPAAVNAVPASGKTIFYWIGLVILLLALVFVARKVGTEEDFRSGNLKASFYNFMAITLTSIVGITGMKVIATKWRVPGASDVILAA